MGLRLSLLRLAEPEVTPYAGNAALSTPEASVRHLEASHLLHLIAEMVQSLQHIAGFRRQVVAYLALERELMGFR